MAPTIRRPAGKSNRSALGLPRARGRQGKTGGDGKRRWGDRLTRRTSGSKWDGRLPSLMLEGRRRVGGPSRADGINVPMGKSELFAGKPEGPG